MVMDTTEFSSQVQVIFYMSSNQHQLLVHQPNRILKSSDYSGATILIVSDWNFENRVIIIEKDTI